MKRSFTASQQFAVSIKVEELQTATSRFVPTSSTTRDFDES